MKNAPSKWIKFRRALHQRPEISEEEKETSRAISNMLKGMEPDEFVGNIGGYGIIAGFGKGNGKTIAIRAELDALPIQEISSLPHKSEFAGKGHMCGHDGHATIILAVAEYFSINRPNNGKVLFIFQPAEENGVGAQAILDDPKWKAFHPDAVLALHNIPGEALHSVIIKPGAFTAAVKSIIIHMKGKTSHAAEPENGINPAMAIAELMLKGNDLTNNDLNREDFKLIIPIHVEMGEVAYGISAGNAMVRWTIRTWTQDVMNSLEEEIIAFLKELASKYKLEVSWEWTQVFQANENDPHLVEVIASTAKDLKLQVKERPFPFKWGEDFGAFTQKYPGAMFGLGSGEKQPALHNPDYDFPDELIETGKDLFVHAVRKLLND